MQKGTKTTLEEIEIWFRDIIKKIEVWFEDVIKEINKNSSGDKTQDLEKFKKKVQAVSLGATQDIKKMNLADAMAGVSGIFMLLSFFVPAKRISLGPFSHSLTLLDATGNMPIVILVPIIGLAMIIAPCVFYYNNAPRKYRIVYIIPLAVLFFLFLMSVLISLFIPYGIGFMIFGFILGQGGLAGLMLLFGIALCGFAGILGVWKEEKNIPVEEFIRNKKGR